ncbi:MAG: dTDP-4-dehydrorhamnose 3,5-epimerase [Elusimicrobiales bacterium]
MGQISLKELDVRGVYEIAPFISGDNRGSFVKLFEEDIFRKHGLSTSFVEEYYSVSKKGVVRGLHFQEPPADCAKLVYCIKGAVLDAALDIRKKSPSFGRHILAMLSEHNKKILYLPPGIAHGFYALEDDTVMVYKVTAGYAAAQDKGLLWNSCGIKWPSGAVIISERDASFPRMSDYASPF